MIRPTRWTGRGLCAALVVACAAGASAQEGEGDRIARTPPGPIDRLPGDREGASPRKQACARNEEAREAAKYVARLRAALEKVVFPQFSLGRENGQDPCGNTLDSVLQHELYDAIAKAAGAEAYASTALLAAATTADFYKLEIGRFRRRPLSTPASTPAS